MRVLSARSRALEPDSARQRHESPPSITKSRRGSREVVVVKAKVGLPGAKVGFSGVFARRDSAEVSPGTAQVDPVALELGRSGAKETPTLTHVADEEVYLRIHQAEMHHLSPFVRGCWAKWLTRILKPGCCQAL